jgi:hypothetical protein
MHTQGFFPLLQHLQEHETDFPRSKSLTTL